ncbi:MAG: hypothetical protein ACRDRY_02175 [Pseudonocardiaceae bacterium]
MVLLVGVILILVSAFTTTLARDVLINLGASVIGVFLTAIVLEPLIERGRRPEEIIYPEFPHQNYITGLDRCSECVRIMGAWPYVMEDRWRGDFLAALAGALRRGVAVQMLVLDPTSKAAEQRSLDLDNHVEVSSVISNVLQSLAKFGASLPESSNANLEIRVYSALPPARMYRWDNRALSSFFPKGSGLGTEVRHYETNVTSSLGRFVDEQFDVVWYDADTQDLAEYLSLTVTLLITGESYGIPYVVLDGTIFAVAVDLTDNIFRNSITDTVVKLETRPGSSNATLGDHLIIRSVPDQDAQVAMIQMRFRRKYGVANALSEGFRAVVGLRPPL